MTLPDKINLGNPLHNEHYSTVQVIVRGSRPDEKIVIKGEAMIYSVAILKNAPNKAAAEAFMAFLLSESGGRKILKEMGQDPVALRN